MMYKALLKGNGKIEVTKQSKALRPIIAYQYDGQIERDTVYAIVLTTESGIRIKLFDMNAKAYIRMIWPYALIAKEFDNRDKKERYLTIGTNIGSFKTPAQVPQMNIHAGNRIMREIWTKSVPNFFKIIQAIEEMYATEKSVTHKAWLSSLEKKDIFDFKVSIAHQLGDKKYLDFVNKV